MKAFTRKALIDAFMRLCGEKPIAKITVKDIVSACGVSSQTFYNHFLDKQDLMNSVFAVEVETMRGEFEKTSFDIGGVADLVGTIMAHCREFKGYYQAIAGYSTQNGFDELLVDATRGFYADLAHTCGYPTPLPPHIHELVEFTTAGCTRLLSSWIVSGMIEDPYEKAREIVGFLPREMIQIVEEAGRRIAEQTAR